MLVLDVLLLLAVFQIKHYLVDFTRLQTPWMYQNKGNPKHPGGYAHAALHALGTLVALYAAMFIGVRILPSLKAVQAEWVVAQALAVEFVWHWITDLVKTDVVKVKGWKADKHPQFWNALGVDQLSHQLCYLVLVAILVKPLL